MSVFKRGLNVQKMAKTINKYSMKIELALVRCEDRYTLDYNVVAKDKIINHISLDITEQEFNDFVNKNTNQIVKRC